MAFDIILAVFLVILNGFFVAAEFAIVKVRASQIDLKIQEGARAAKIAKHITTHLDGYLAATQLGITIASIGLGFVGENVGEQILLSLFGGVLSPEEAHRWSVPVAFFLVTILHIVFGELAPKSIAIQRPISTSIAIALPLQLFYYIFRPIVWLLNGFANLMLRMIGIKPVTGREVHTTEELQLLLAQGMETGALDSSEHELIQNVFDFKDRIVKNIMVPRTEISAIDINTSSEEVLNIIINERYTRFPVFDKSIDNIVGIIHAKDVLVKVRDGQEVVPGEIMREPYFTPESKNVSDLLKELQLKKNTMMAVVLDEFGGTAGMVTLEDIVEELVGEIQDEYDEEKPVVEQVDENEYLVNALAPITDVNEFLPEELPEDDDYDTVAGLMNVIFEKIPEVGETKDAYGYNFTILTKINRKVESVRLLRLEGDEVTENSEDE
ncbi:CBS domain containing-hemolysin-like protein [Anseongella ginsenosidimutans]|uniref:CBS domain containing-hemolysin-like protein n=1 Tax=Anseongella ginsenosidimutans TaxID=496056 RepID=A0A4R3KVE2_9SPHI|nr:hemolysin family protein [Anseongella ginsenosidimutans]QEC51701.1 HlyC/CorC family transporter [Anseongella ginsenosidimutans]TCS89061.1 CBS domain containing-hemolysin-like protein [Anseongella ginsenosidimutans]